MNICRYFLCFAVFSFIGWAYETVYYSVQHRKLVNSGFLSTCFCPIYGIGAMLDLLLLGGIKNPFALFAAGMAVTGSLEYFVSWLLERLFGRRWWDYTGWPLNINGRICVISVTMFGIATVALIKFIAPFTFGMINRIDNTACAALTVVIAAVMVADAARSAMHTDAAKLWYVEKQSGVFRELEHSEVVEKIKHAFKR